MNTVSIVNSVSRKAGGLFESVRRPHQELLKNAEGMNGDSQETSHPEDNAIGVRVLGLRDEFTELDLGGWDPVPVHTFEVQGPRTFGYAPGLLGKLMALDPDVVHVHGLWQYCSLAAARWGLRTRKPYLVSPHGMLDSWAVSHSAWKKRLAWLIYERRHLANAACIRALSRSEADSIRALGLRNPVCIIPNGIDLPDLSQRREGVARLDFNSRRDWRSPIPTGRKVLLYLGRIHPKKGLANLIKAWARANRPAEWVLVIAGWDQCQHEAQLKRLALALEIAWCDTRSALENSTSLAFPGPQFGSAKRTWLSSCHAVILPSLSEGLPMAVLEAWAYAKPVLMTPECNLHEGLAAGAAIRIESDPDGIANGLQELFIFSNSTVQSIGARGRGLVACRFTWPKVACDLKRVYEWIAGVGPQPGCVLPD